MILTDKITEYNTTVDLCKEKCAKKFDKGVFMLQDHLPKLASGFYVCGHPSRDKSYLSYSTPYISFSRPSSGQVIHLTPEEAKALAQVLLTEAAHAEHGGAK